MLCFSLSGLFPAVCRAATVAGTTITHSKAQLTSATIGSTVIESNQPAATIVQPYYGFATSTFTESQDVMTTTEGVSVEYTFEVRNDGNTPDAVRLEISSLALGGTAGTNAQWSVEVDDEQPFVTGLTWQNSGTTVSSSGGDAATSATPVQPGQNARFTVRVTPVSGTTDGSTLNFDISIRTLSTPVGVYTGFNSTDYGGGDMVLSAAKTAQVTDDAPPRVAITSPADNSVASGAISIKGYAYDGNFSEYSLYYATGAEPIDDWTILKTSSGQITDQAGAAIYSWNTYDRFGTYTIRLSATDTSGNNTVDSVAVKLENNLIATGTIPGDEWTMVSFPGIPLNGDPRVFLGDGTYEVQQWDEDMVEDEHLHKYRRTFSLNTAGEAFWVKSYGAALSYQGQLWYTDSTQDYSMPLKVGWNQIGCPYDRAEGINWSAVQVKNTTTQEVRDMASAITAGWIDSNYHEYTGTQYESHALGDSVEPFKGYFVKAYENVELLFDPSSGVPRMLARIVRPQYEWKMQLSAETQQVSDTDNVAALLRGADEEFDSNDAGEPPTVEPYVSLYFENGEWSRNAGRYSKDMRPPEADGSAKTWHFSVEVSNPGEEVTVSVPNANELPEHYDFTIRDEDTGREFDPKSNGTYAFIAPESGRKNFTLRAVKSGTLETTTLAKTFPPGWTLFSVPLEPEPTEVKAQLADDLDPIQVFQYFDRSMYNPNSPEHVDIQAGIGYWLHLDEEKELDFSGILTDESIPIEIGLPEGWNLIGNPYQSEIVFGEQVQVKKGEESKTLGEAMEEGWISPWIYGFDSDTGGYEVFELGTPLQPWRGYAIKALVPCTIIIKTGP